MKKLLIVMILASVAFVKADEKLGKDLTLKEKTSISIILSTPEKFDGQKVLVEGMIADVCQEMGCWIDIAGEKEGEIIKVKVKDGEIVFPKDSKGKTVMVEGVVEKVTAAKTEHSEMKEVKDHKEGETCEADKVTYRIKGLGAVIK
ncbi:MAG: hypothetical protein CVV24_09030 [Ignavibacteriae bacterium HGW-Ignavibacteriae-3]|nr:MAG: hypothetical protein CVV24_09030 [Ignavibacteriae bacterium HGW-Ignavibacteriae-3]